VPARDIAIVGQGLRSIERITGRLGYAAAARSGAINGILLGLLFSAILVIGTPAVPIQAFVGVLFVGIAIGMLLNIATYSIVRRRRDYASVMQVVADHYEVTVAAASIHRARQVLGSQPVAAAAAPSAPAPAAHGASGRSDEPPVPAPSSHDDSSLSEPPRYGERVSPVPAAESEPRGEAEAGAGDGAADTTGDGDDDTRDGTADGAAGDPRSRPADR
jgi:hypothetical protein